MVSVISVLPLIIICIFVLGCCMFWYRTQIFGIDGFCSSSEMDVFDMMSLSYKCVKATPSNIPKCITNQTYMMSTPSDSIHCGTITGYTGYTSKCTTDLSDPTNYKINCPLQVSDASSSASASPPPGWLPSVASSSSSSSPSSSSSSSTSVSVPDPYSMTAYNPTISPKQYPDVEIGPFNTTIVSTLTINAEPTPCSSMSSGSSSLANQSQSTPTELNYTQSSSKVSDTSGGVSNVSGNMGSSGATPVVVQSTFGQSAEITGNSSNTSNSSIGNTPSTQTYTSISSLLGAFTYPQPSTSSTPNGSSSVTGSTIGSSVSQPSHTYKNVPFPYLPPFRA